MLSSSAVQGLVIRGAKPTDGRRWAFLSLKTVTPNLLQQSLDDVLRDLGNVLVDG
jgi:hypothetical protein